MNDCNFTLKHYAECLELAMEKGYTFITFKDLIDKKPKEPFIVLRHDIDQHMDPVHWMVVIENRLGIKANYFFRVHGRYNLQFHKSLQILDEVLLGDHLIGLHYDPFFNTLDKDRKILKHVIGRSRAMYTTSHDPERNTVPQDRQRFVDHQDMEEYNLKYISDSSHHWREETFCQAIEQGHPRLYVLIHPMWWYLHSSVENY